MDRVLSICLCRKRGVAIRPSLPLLQYRYNYMLNSIIYCPKRSMSTAHGQDVSLRKASLGDSKQLTRSEMVNIAPQQTL